MGVWSKRESGGEQMKNKTDNCPCRKCKSDISSRCMQTKCTKWHRWFSEEWNRLTSEIKCSVRHR